MNTHNLFPLRREKIENEMFVFDNTLVVIDGHRLSGNVSLRAYFQTKKLHLLLVYSNITDLNSIKLIRHSHFQKVAVHFL